MKNDVVSFHSVENRIIDLRGQKVILDSDVAALYGIETKRVNEAVKNNPEKFPDGYILTLSKEEKNEIIRIFDDSKKKFAAETPEVVENFDHLNLKFSPSTPKAFTEKGLYMLATILKSERATKTTIAIVETFTKIRELSITVAELSQTNNQYEQKNLMQKSGDIIADILGDDLQKTDTETSIELNLAVLKFKHTVKRKNDK